MLFDVPSNSIGNPAHAFQSKQPRESNSNDDLNPQRAIVFFLIKTIWTSVWFFGFRKRKIQTTNFVANLARLSNQPFLIKKNDSQVKQNCSKPGFFKSFRSKKKNKLDSKARVFLKSGTVVSLDSDEIRLCRTEIDAILESFCFKKKQMLFTRKVLENL